MIEVFESTVPAMAFARPSLFPVPRLLGAHMPTAGGLQKSLIAGAAIGCGVVQLFTNSPRQWSHKPLAPEAVNLFRQTQEEVGIPFTVAHDSYLINLAAPDPVILERSREAFRAELDRANELGIAWVVTHMGAHLGQGESEAVARLIESFKLVLEDTDKAGYTTGIAMETTAGQGTGLGWRFEELGEIIRGVGGHPRLGVCLDTCHVFAAGYDLRGASGYAKTIAEFDSVIGLANLKVIHANDSKKGFGSRVDRHEHLGAGEIGIGAFARFVNDPRLAHIPMLVETPDSETMHTVNLARLKGLQGLQTTGEGDTIVSVQFFGHYSDYFAGVPLDIAVPEGTTVREFAELLGRRDARLSGVERGCRFAISEEYVTLDTPIAADCMIAVLPPMSGG